MTNNDLQSIHIQLKIEHELMWSGRVGSSCSTSGTRRVNLVTNQLISHEWGNLHHCNNRFHHIWCISHHNSHHWISHVSYNSLHTQAHLPSMLAFYCDWMSLLKTNYCQIQHAFFPIITSLHIWLNPWPRSYSFVSHYFDQHTKEAMIRTQKGDLDTKEITRHIPLSY